MTFSKPTLSKPSRRGFLQVGASAAAGLLIGFYIPEKSQLAAQQLAANGTVDPAAPVRLNA
jgi:hypothetical protein